MTITCYLIKGNPIPIIFHPLLCAELDISLFSFLFSNKNDIALLHKLIVEKCLFF